MKVCSIAVSTLLILASLLVCGCAEPASKQVTLVGQFKDSSNDRVFAATFAPDTTAETIRAFGMGATNTSGRVTAVYFFAAGGENPGAALKGAGSLEQAVSVVAGAKGLAYVYQRATNGKEEFVSCARDPDHGFCRKP